MVRIRVSDTEMLHYESRKPMYFAAKMSRVKGQVMSYTYCTTDYISYGYYYFSHVLYRLMTQIETYVLQIKLRDKELILFVLNKKTTTQLKKIPNAY